MPLETSGSFPETDALPEMPMVFNHPADRDFWINIPPCLSDNPTDREAKPYIEIENYIKQRFPDAKDLGKNLKFVKRCLIGLGTYAALHGADMIGWRWFRKAMLILSFPCHTGKIKIQKLTSYLLRMNCGKVSPFAGLMKQEEAEKLLKREGVLEESYLVRFSESLSDRGGFSLAVKANATQVHHYNIVGTPDRALEDSRYYNARLKLVHHNTAELNEEEEPYRDIVHFMQTRLIDEIEDGFLRQQLKIKD